MDPSECFRLMLVRLEAGDVMEAMRHYDALKEWECRGGFMPPEVAAWLHEMELDTSDLMYLEEKQS